MSAIRQFMIVMFAALMAFSPLVAQASYCLHDGETAMSTTCIKISDCSDAATVSAVSQNATPESNRNTQDQQCAGCCMAHTPVLLMADLVDGEALNPKLQTLKLPRDWAGVDRFAPDAILRPPRA